MHEPLELSGTRAHCRFMADPPDTDPKDRTPDERGLEDRSDTPAVSPWILIGLIAMLGAAVYVISAMVMR